MLDIFASIIDGILVGAVYGLAAMGLTLIWGVMTSTLPGVIIVISMFVLYLVVYSLGVHPYVAVPAMIMSGSFPKIHPGLDSRARGESSHFDGRCLRCYTPRQS